MTPLQNSPFPQATLARVSATIMAYPKAVRTDDDFKNRMQVIENLRAAVARVIPDAKLNPFGSFLLGVWQHDSDLDLAVEHHTVMNEAIVLRRIRDALGRDGFELVLGTRVPVLRLTRPPHGQDFTFDITVNRLNGRCNSLMLADLLRVDPRVIPLTMVCRSWAKAARITDSRNSYLSSYSLLLIIVHFLQAVASPPVLPVLQSRENIQRAKRRESGWVLRSEKGETRVQEWAIPKAWKSKNMMSVAELLLRFLRWMAIEFDYEQYGIVASLGEAQPKTALHRRVWES
jgi:poly(A) RNA polymerase GLD2